jgi:hypothetical protein
MKPRIVLAACPSCWISEPSHVVGAHGGAMLGLVVAGAVLAVIADLPRWRR